METILPTKNHPKIAKSIVKLQGHCVCHWVRSSSGELIGIFASFLRLCRLLFVLRCLLLWSVFGLALLFPMSLGTPLAKQARRPLQLGGKRGGSSTSFNFGRGCKTTHPKNDDSLAFSRRAKNQTNHKCETVVVFGVGGRLLHPKTTTVWRFSTRVEEYSTRVE
jgi:hypothetical protein